MNRQGIHLRGNQKEGSPHYVYLDEEDYDEDNILLQNIDRSPTRLRKIEVINIEVKPEDTLQALALRYGCTISALKQINKIDKENEIHARPHIKVPVQPFSLLIETLADKQKCDDNPTSAQDSGSESTEEEIIYSPTTMNMQSPGSEINTIILNSVCTPLLSHNSIKISHTENNSLSSNRQRTGIMRDMFNCSGDDCGLSWKQLIIYTFLVFVIPVIYIYIHVTNTFGRGSKENVTTSTD